MSRPSDGATADDEVFLGGILFNPVAVAHPDFSVIETSPSRRERSSITESFSLHSSTLATPCEEEEEEEDDDVEIVGQSGSNAITDWPHPREECAIKAFETGDRGKCREVCEKCFCFVCDVVAKNCRAWSEHCVATRKLRQWVDERARIKAGGRVLPLFGGNSLRASPPSSEEMTTRRRAESVYSLVRLLRNNMIDDRAISGARSLRLDPDRDRAVSSMLATERTRGGGIFFENFVASCVAALHVEDAEQQRFSEARFVDDGVTVVVTSPDRAAAWGQRFSEFSLPFSTFFGNNSHQPLNANTGVLIMDGAHFGRLRSLFVRRLVMDHDGIFHHRDNGHLRNAIVRLKATFVWIFARDPFNFDFRQLREAASILRKDSDAFKTALAFMESYDPTMLARNLSSWAVCTVGNNNNNRKRQSPHRQNRRPRARNNLAAPSPSSHHHRAFPAERSPTRPFFRSEQFPHHHHIYHSNVDLQHPSPSPVQTLGRMPQSPPPRQPTQQHRQQGFRPAPNFDVNTGWFSEDEIPPSFRREQW